jgi:hypothetical protein
MSLQTIELELLRTLPSLNLRPTLEAAQTAGKLLDQARDLVPHGGWLQFLSRIGLTQRTAHDYVTVHRHAGDQRPAATMTIKQFLVQIREAQRRERLAERNRFRKEVAERAGQLAEGVQLVNADCRKFEWPEVDAVVTDPPWKDIEMYEWLGRFGMTKLKPGGLLLVQVGTSSILDVGNILSSAGLTYRWTLAVVYHATWYCRPFRNWSPGWRPVLAYSRGEGGKLPLTTDTFTVPPLIKQRGGKHHDWEQPLEPWVHWIGRLIPEGSLIADPFCGSGTVGVACQRTGRRYIGTEIDTKAFRVARGRLAGEVTIPANDEMITVTGRPSSSLPDTAAPGRRPKQRAGRRPKSPFERDR